MEKKKDARKGIMFGDKNNIFIFVKNDKDANIYDVTQLTYPTVEQALCSELVCATSCIMMDEDGEVVKDYDAWMNKGHDAIFSISGHASQYKKFQIREKDLHEEKYFVGLDRELLIRVLYNKINKEAKEKAK